MTMTTLSRSDVGRLHGVRSRLTRELADLKLAGLDGGERAAQIAAEIQTVTARIDEAREERQDSRLDELKAKKEAEDRHAAEMARRAEAARREGAAREWLSGQGWNGEPIEAVEALAAASREGHAASDVLAVARRYRRRADGVEVLALADGSHVQWAQYMPLDA
jgi:hypothetical protein